MILRTKHVEKKYLNDEDFFSVILSFHQDLVGISESDSHFYYSQKLLTKSLCYDKLENLDNFFLQKSQNIAQL